MGLFKPLKLIVEYQSNDYTKTLENEIQRLKAENVKLERQALDLSHKYGYESHVNNELIDILRDNKIYFRSSAILHKK